MIDNSGRLLIACEMSGRVREAFRKLGHDAWSCDILPSEIPSKYHIQDDVMKHLDDGWGMLIAHPPCTYLTVTGNKWFKPEFATRFPNRKKQRVDAIEFFMNLVRCKIPRIAVENPVGILSTTFRKPDQIIEPFWFGDEQRKKTCLWLKNLPLLKPTKMVKPKLYVYANGRTDGLWHVETMKLPQNERSIARSRTFNGIANAMAEQWGVFLNKQSGDSVSPL